MRLFLFISLFLMGAKHMHAQSFDLTKDVQSFSVSGIPVILRQTPDFADISSEIVALRITAFGGVKLADKAGTLELLADLLTKGTYSYSKEKINEILVRTGASLSIEAGYEAFTIQVKCLKRFLPEVLALVSEMTRVPLFEENEINLSKDQLLNQLKSEQQHPDSVLALQMHKAFYAGHPYLQRPSGFLETLPSIKRDDLASSFFKTFNKNNLIIVLVGELSREQTTEYISKYFGSLPDGKRAADVTEAINNQLGIQFTKFEAPTTYFMAKFKAPSLESEDYPALSIALQILDNRLFDEVRTKRALTYAVRSSFGNSKINSGTLYVSSTQLPVALDVMFQEVKKLQVEPVSAELLKLQVSKFLSSWYLSRETRASQAAIFAQYEVMGIGWENANSFISRLERVTPEDVQRVMKQYLKDFSIAVVGPQEPQIQNVLSGLGFLPTNPASLSKEEKPEAVEQPKTKETSNP